MRCLLLLASLILGLPAGAAEPCETGAEGVLHTADALVFSAESFHGNELTLTYSGQPECTSGLEVGMDINQAEARALTTKAAADAVLFARTRIDGERVRVRFSGSAEILAALGERWRQTGSLRGIIRFAELRWWAYYHSSVNILSPSAVESLGRICRPAVHAQMQCEERKGWRFKTQPDCTRRPEVLARLRSAIRYEEFFLNGDQDRVRVLGVAQNLCGAPFARTDFTAAAAEDLIFGEIDLDSRKAVSQLARIHVKGEIVW